MSKRGRPKLARERYPSGQVRPETSGITWTELQRMRRSARDPLHGTEVGRLLFLEEITLLESQVAFMIATIYGAHDRAIGCRRSPGSPSYEAGRGRDYRLHESEFERRQHERAMEAFDELATLLRPFSAHARNALVDLCVHDLALTWPTMIQVRSILVALAEPLGLKRRKRA